MNPLGYVLNRRSIRKFKKKKVEKRILDILINAGQRAPTAGNMQPYSFVVITDTTKREKLYQLSWNQEWVKAPLLLYVCIDLRRGNLFTRYYGGKDTSSKGIGHLLFPIIDASLAVENMVIAAEMLGLGSVIVGTPTEYPEEVAELLELPENVYPLVLLCMGYPAENPRNKYRWDPSAVLHYNRYKDITEGEIQTYAQKIEEFTGISGEAFIKKVEEQYPEEELKKAVQRMNKFFQ
ncbi:MAG: nitroreductase family protein [Theionarchaea archaeon]|nr:MAG: hypothetical protein AYK18_12480 [Theionarchaea archaeon DG-70]MBU7012313.1 nitroreductase family protein [Theionarchaea archaeon]